jgi:hypothetical protein
MLPRIEYSVTVQVPIEAAFQAFQNLERLLNRKVYDEISWVEGKPWQVGSRLRYALIYPIETTISSVVTAIHPPRSITLLNHALGVTAEQNVFFGPAPNGGTLVRMTMDLVGTSTELSEAALQAKVTFVVKDSLDTMVRLCQQRASSASG